MQSKKTKPHKTWLEISKKSLNKNASTFKKVVGGKTKIACVVKANAYGHGLEEVVTALDKNKIDWFAVDNLDEALPIRSLGVKKPIILLGYTPFSQLRQAIESDISLTVYDKTTLEKITSLKTKKEARVHLKIETGLNRQGVKGSGLLALAKYIKKNKNLKLEGVSTHFANIEDTLDPSFAMEQLKRFREEIKMLRKNKIEIPEIHCAASAAALLYEKTRFTMIRLGIGLYGLWPSRETKISLNLKKKDVELEPVMTWKTIVAQIKEVKAGESVGYGRTWFSPKDSKIAILPVGYSDGYDRKLSNNSRVIIKGRSAPVVGRVAMNMIVADISEIENVAKEDEVILLGKDKDEEVSAEELATRMGTINYEVVSRVNPMLPREVV